MYENENVEQLVSQAVALDYSHKNSILSIILHYISLSQKRLYLIKFIYHRIVYCFFYTKWSYYLMC